MSLFGDVAGKLAGGGGGQGLVGAIVEMLTSRPGGLTGLVEAFQQKGLGNIVQSWIGAGPNLPVSADQVRQVFGNDQIQAIAQKAGVPPETAAPQVAEFLPNLVDKLTPGGQIPQGGDLLSAGAGLLQNLMPGGKPGS